MELVNFKKVVRKCVLYYGYLGIFVGAIIFVLSIFNKEMSINILNGTLTGIKAGFAFLIMIPIIVTIVGFFHSFLLWYPIILLFKNNFKLFKVTKEFRKYKKVEVNKRHFIDTLEKSFLFAGRINRAKFILGSIVFLSIEMIFSYSTFIPEFVGMIISLLAVIALFSITVKRLHDIEYRSINALMFFVPIYNFYMWYLVLFVRGTVGVNYYDES